MEDEKSSNLVSFVKYFDVEQNLVNRLGKVLKTIGRNFYLRLDQCTVLFENRRKYRYLMTFVYHSSISLCG